MKNALIISYWVVAILLLASLLASLGYVFTESIFIASLFLPGAMAAKYLYPKVSFIDKKEGVLNALFITAGILITEVLLFIIAHGYLTIVRDGAHWNEWPDLPSMMCNPIFIATMIAVLSVGNHFYEKWLDKILPTEDKPVTFLSERKPISLMRDEILYIESNDSITMVYATNGRAFRNKTAISQWEDFLGKGFLRIHRSYLVNKNFIDHIESDTVTICGHELPVSRKYKATVSSEKELSSFDDK